MKILQIGMGQNPDGLQKAFAAKGEHKYLWSGDKELNAKIIAISASWKPDLIYMQVQCEGVLRNGALANAKANGAYIVNWCGDARNPLPEWYIETGKVIDMTCFTNQRDVDTMIAMGLNASFLQEGYDTEIFSPFGEKIDGDIVFVGSNYGDDRFPLSKERRVMVETLKANFGNKFQVYGNRWGWGRQVDQLEAAKIYRGAKIVINHSHFNLPRYTSNRMIFAMACGACVMTHNFQDVDKDWSDYNELIVCDMRPLLINCDTYLDQINNKERNRIAHNGYIKVKENYTFEHFVDNVIAMIP